MTDAVIEAMAGAIAKTIARRLAGLSEGERWINDARREEARAALLAGQNVMRAAVAAEVRGECAKVADAVAENMRSLCAHYRKGGTPQFATESLLQQRTAEAIAATIRAG